MKYFILILLFTHTILHHTFAQSTNKRTGKSTKTEISGRVTDNEKAPLVEASVVLKWRDSL